MRFARSPEVWIVLLILVVFGPFVQQMSAQSAARYALTAAIWERHTLDVDGYTLGVDKVVLPDGRLRSDKPPLQPLLAVPVFALGRVAGVEPATHRRVVGNLGLWWVTFWSTVVPLCFLVVLMRRVAVKLRARAPTLAALGIVFATTMAAFASQLYAHVLAAALIFGAWYLMRAADRERRWRWLGSGLLVGAAIITAYETIPLAVVLTGFVAWRARDRIGWFLLGGVPAAILGGVYNRIAFGKFWRISYGQKSGHRGVFGVAVPRLSIMAQIVFGGRGLLLVTPLVLVALAAAVMVARKPGPARVDAVVGLLCFAGLFALQSSWSNPWGGESPGPRYLITALPFLAAPLAVAWPRIRRLAIVAGAWGAFCMACAVMTTSAVVNIHLSLFTWWRDQLEHGKLTPTVWTMAAGTWGWAIHALLVAAAIVGLWRATRPRDANDAAVSSPRATRV